MSFIATLPMYDMPEVREATSALLTQIANAMTGAGWPIEPTFREFADHAALVKHWRDPDVAVSHSCGLPFLEDLVDSAQILGTFQWHGVSDECGRYRSVIVVRRDDQRTIEKLAGAQPVINSPESLSGWCSLGAALHERGYSAKDFPTSMVSGAHSRSIELVASGNGDFTSIDGATLQLLKRHRPQAVSGIRAIGLGPLIPATPLITRRSTPIPIDRMKSALMDAVIDNSMAAIRDRLGIDRFIPLHADDYSSIAEFVTQAATVLPRLSSLSS
jgi:ABC-type phosphate/phosphonate transport system substrate-binding protein